MIFPTMRLPIVNCEFVAWHEENMDVENGISAFGLWLVDLIYPPLWFRRRI